MSKGKRDLFDVLGIGTHEDHYTTLLANLFEDNQRWAQAYFEKTLCSDAPDGPVKARTQLHVPHGNSRKADRLDLVLTFGDLVTDIWLIEAKVKSGESSDQLQRYGKDKGTQRRILQRLGLENKEPSQIKWHYSYLTLEGEEPAGTTEFRPTTYEPLRKILPADPNLARELFPAHRCLRSRLDDYYKARAEVLSGVAPPDDMPLKDYLSDTWDLIDETNKFHWLMKKITKEVAPSPDIELQTAPIVVQNRGFANPGCQIRSSHWHADKLYDIKAKEPPLQECFDIHLELQLSGEHGVGFVLHYETTPYMPSLNKKEEIPEEQRNEYWESRRKFARVLSQHREELKGTGWKLDPIPRSWEDLPPRSRNRNQLAKFSSFGLNQTVGDFRQWVLEGVEAMVQPVEHAGKEVGLKNN